MAAGGYQLERAPVLTGSGGARSVPMDSEVRGLFQWTRRCSNRLGDGPFRWTRRCAVCSNGLGLARSVPMDSEVRGPCALRPNGRSSSVTAEPRRRAVGRPSRGPRGRCAARLVKIQSASAPPGRLGREYHHRCSGQSESRLDSRRTAAVGITRRARPAQDTPTHPAQRLEASACLPLRLSVSASRAGRRGPVCVAASPRSGRADRCDD